MSGKLHSVVMSHALAGLMAGALVACGGSEEAAPAPEPAAEAPAEEAEKPAEAAPEETAADGADAEADQPVTVKAHHCKGQNECKGQGG